VGGIVDTLNELHLSQNTLVIFTSDNGGMLNNSGQQAWEKGHRLNGDLLGFKFGAWEGGHRIPFIAKWPGKIKANTVSESLICSIDLFATFTSLFNRPLQKDEGLDSVNLLPVLLGSGKEKVREELLYSPSSSKHKSIRHKNWVYIPARNEGGFTGSKRGGHAFGGAGAHTFTKHVNSDIQNGKIKPDAPNAQLYNLDNDLSQTKNVIREYPEMAHKLSLQLQKILQSPTAPHLK
jgi:arylsulfatase A-like enzyme